MAQFDNQSDVHPQFDNVNAATLQLIQQALGGGGTGQIPIMPNLQGSASDGGINTAILAQYGLLTPANSGSFQIPGLSATGAMVSPLQIPGGSMMGGRSSNDHSGNAHMGPAFQHPHNGSGQQGDLTTPGESPAFTPASVFSALGNGSVASTADFLSPLISPALHPDPPMMGAPGEMLPPPLTSGFFNHAMQFQQHHHHQHNSTTPTASPLALMGRSHPPTGANVPAGLPSKRNRGASVAEAKGPKVRPSPLMKPQGGRRKRDSSNPTGMPQSHAGSQPVSRRGSLTEKTGAHSRAGSLTSSSAAVAAAMAASNSSNGNTGQVPPFPLEALPNGFPSLPLQAGASTSMVTSPAAGSSSSTPSPIDLNADSNAMAPGPSGQSQPMTPASIMGFGGPPQGQMGLPSLQHVQLPHLQANLQHQQAIAARAAQIMAAGQALAQAKEMANEKAAQQQAAQAAKSSFKGKGRASLDAKVSFGGNVGKGESSRAQDTSFCRRILTRVLLFRRLRRF